MFNRIVSLTMLALLASAPASAHSKHHEPCPNELNGVRGTVEVTGSIADRLTTEVVQGCGFEVVETVLCQTDVTAFYGCPALLDVANCQPFPAPAFPCLPCFGQTKNQLFQTIFLWENAQEYHIRARVKFCKLFCRCQLPSIMVTLQSRGSLAGIDDCGPNDIEGKPRATNVAYDDNGVATGRFELHPLTVRAVSQTEFEVSAILTIFTLSLTVADSIFDAIFDPTLPEILRTKIHFQAEKECDLCCTILGTCL